ncbi:hypothetical protein [Streptomyces sp. E5N91]|uniref:hypothetical protein n=1 Tax=Streptomyces sp. E5N91 TaxID=1851996 RepID=UPI00187D11D5|nr:hypothetical protein [Streptomyces sp. E5N91]
MDAVRVALLREVLAGTEWLGATRLATGGSLVALFGAGAAAGYLMRRPPRTTRGP